MYKAQYFSPLEHIFPQHLTLYVFFFEHVQPPCFHQTGAFASLLLLFYIQRITHTLGVLDFLSSHTQCQLIVTLSHSLFTSFCYTPPHIFFFSQIVQKKSMSKLYIYFFFCTLPFTIPL